MADAAVSASLGPVLEFMRSLWALDHALSERARDVGARFGITGTQRLVVRIVGQSPGSSAGAVSRILHVHPSTLTPVLQQLVARGLVHRAADPLDRRRAVLWLTARGERIDAESASTVDALVRRTLARLTASEVLQARRVMHALAEALASAGHPPAGRAKGTRRRPARSMRPPRVRIAAVKGAADGGATRVKDADERRRSVAR